MNGIKKMVLSTILTEEIEKSETEIKECLIEIQKARREIFSRIDRDLTNYQKEHPKVSAEDISSYRIKLFDEYNAPLDENLIKLGESRGNMVLLRSIYSL